MLKKGTETSWCATQRTSTSLLNSLWWRQSFPHISPNLCQGHPHFHTYNNTICQRRRQPGNKAKHVRKQMGQTDNPSSPTKAQPPAEKRKKEDPFQVKPNKPTQQQGSLPHTAPTSKVTESKKQRKSKQPNNKGTSPVFERGIFPKSNPTHKQQTNPVAKLSLHTAPTSQPIKFKSKGNPSSSIKEHLQK